MIQSIGDFRHKFCFFLFVMMKFVCLKNLIFLALLCFWLSSCQSIVFFSSKAKYGGSEGNIDIANLSERRRMVIEEAERWIGVPYCLGGNEKCVDCSGFVQNVYARIGIVLPRTAAEQSKLGKLVDFNGVKVGDLLFFGGRNRVTHVAIYAGNGELIHSSTSRGVVRERFEHLSRNFLFAKQLIE